MPARLGDLRQVDRIAEHLAQVGEQRSRIETEIARWEQTADDLVTKTSTWGVARVDAAMAPDPARDRTPSAVTIKVAGEADPGGGR